MLDDKLLAMLGDKAAAERLTEAGILLPCYRCGGAATITPTFCSGRENPFYWWKIRCEKCHVELGGYGTEYSMNKNEKFEIIKRVDGRKETVKIWNTRAPILTPEQIKRLEEHSHDE